MSEVHRYQVVTMLSAAGATIGYDPHGPDVVMAAEFDRVTAERDAALRDLEQQKRYVEINANSAHGKHKEAMQYRAERDALQDRLTAADERADVLEGLLRDMRKGDFALISSFWNRIDAALKPAEARCNIPACDYQIDMDQN